METQNEIQTVEKTKFCKHCGAKIPEDAKGLKKIKIPTTGVLLDKK